MCLYVCVQHASSHFCQINFKYIVLKPQYINQEEAAFMASFHLKLMPGERRGPLWTNIKWSVTAVMKGRSPPCHQLLPAMGWRWKQQHILTIVKWHWNGPNSRHINPGVTDGGMFCHSFTRGGVRETAFAITSTQQSTISRRRAWFDSYHGWRAAPPNASNYETIPPRCKQTLSAAFKVWGRRN